MKRVFLLFLTISLIQNSFGQSPSPGRFIDSYTKEHDLNGTILIQKKSKITYQKSFGYANIQFKIPNSIKTKYTIASITKAFTSVLILQLYEQGKIDLNKTIRIYLPIYSGEAGDKVTIHQLLNHTSGIANIDRNITSAESAIKNGFPQSAITKLPTAKFWKVAVLRLMLRLN